MNFKKTWDKSEGISTLFDGGNLNMLGLKMLKLSEGNGQWCQFPGMEAAIVILKGKCDIMGEKFLYKLVGERAGVFGGVRRPRYTCPREWASQSARLPILKRP